MATRDEINAGYSTAYDAAKAKGVSEADFVKSSDYGASAGQLNSYYGNLSDPGEITSELAYHQGRINDPLHGASARQFVSTLQSRQAATAKPPAAAPGLGGEPGLQAGPAKPTVDPAYVPAPYAVKDDAVESFLPGLLAKSGPLMTKAVGDATRAANRRGLQNSSMAVGEGQKAALSVAVPIASQNAAQTAQKNLAAQGFGYNSQLQGQQIEGQAGIVGMQLRADAEKQRQADAAAMDRMRQQGVNEQQIQIMRDASEKERQGIQLNSEETRALNELRNRTDIQETVNLQNSRDAGGRMINNANATYASYVSAIMQNENIPAAQRTTLIADAAARRDSEIALAQEIFGLDISWTTTPEAPPTPATNTNPNINQPGGPR